MIAALPRKKAKGEAAMRVPDRQELGDAGLPLRFEHRDRVRASRRPAPVSVGFARHGLARGLTACVG
jgi:hypothetical protein